MAHQVTYLDRFTIHQGKLDDFGRYAAKMVEFVQNKEPETVSFNYYVDEAGTGGTAVFVFVDADALDRHLDLVAPTFQEAVQLLSSSDIELLGRPSDRAIEMGKAFNAGLKGKLLAGFTR